jgi:hypothetical protein
MGVVGHRHVPAALPPGMTGYPLYRRLGGPQGRSGRLRKISPPSGFAVQHVASRYTDYAIPVHRCQLRLNIEGNFKEPSTRIGTGFIWLTMGPVLGSYDNTVMNLWVPQSVGLT